MPLVALEYVLSQVSRRLDDVTTRNFQLEFVRQIVRLCHKATLIHLNILRLTLPLELARRKYRLRYRS